MSAKPVPRGRLIAVDGTRGRDIADAARRVWEFLRERGVEGGISRWDASGTFFEARGVKKKEFVPSPRTLLLFHAVDLQFRLKWEIEPLIAEGKTVIVAPYVETARVLGRALGIDREWLDALFAPVPAPDVAFHAKERKKKAGWKDVPEEGLAETCAAAIVNSRPDADLAALRRRMVRAFDKRVDRGALLPVRKRSVRALGKSGKEKG
jgi:hypothetical protein